MPRFANMLASGMKERGHQVEMWSPNPMFFKLPVPSSLKKWMSYIDQYIMFPAQVKKKLKGDLSEVLFVFTDHALGPWVPLVSHLPHVIHCHDFLAQLSAKGEIPSNPTKWTGQKYQDYIRSGYSKGKNFISVSYKTRADLHTFLKTSPNLSEVVHNGLNQSFHPQDYRLARNELTIKTGIDLSRGYILHVGGNQWYKNRSGVIELYNAWRAISNIKIPLLLIGEAPDDSLRHQYLQSSFKQDVHFLTGIEDEYVRLAYSGATVFLFPSLAEGFGWPIAEAMASGSPVITTDEAPMTEVAGKAGLLIPVRPDKVEEAKVWAQKGAFVIENLMQLGEEARKDLIKEGINNANRFDANFALDKIENLYQKILKLT